MDHALIFTWTAPIPGREAKALEVFADSRVFWGKLAADGLIAEPEFFTSAQGGMMVIKGDRAALVDIIGRDDYLVLFNKVRFAVADVDYRFYFTGNMVDTGLMLYAQAGTELGYL